MISVVLIVFIYKSMNVSKNFKKKSKQSYKVLYLSS